MNSVFRLGCVFTALFGALLLVVAMGSVWGAAGIVVGIIIARLAWDGAKPMW